MTNNRDERIRLFIGLAQNRGWDFTEDEAIELYEIVDQVRRRIDHRGRERHE